MPIKIRNSYARSHTAKAGGRTQRAPAERAALPTPPAPAPSPAAPAPLPKRGRPRIPSGPPWPRGRRPGSEQAGTGERPPRRRRRGPAWPGSEQAGIRGSRRHLRQRDTQQREPHRRMTRAAGDKHATAPVASEAHQLPPQLVDGCKASRLLALGILPCGCERGVVLPPESLGVGLALRSRS